MRTWGQVTASLYADLFFLKSLLTIAPEPQIFSKELRAQLKKIPRAGEIFFHERGYRRNLP